MVLVVLGVPLLAIALLQAHTLYLDLTRPPVADWPPPHERIQFPDHHTWAKRALALFAALPTNERARVIAEIERAVEPWPSWLDDLNRRAIAILCIGENHEPYLRRFLADRLFETLKADALMLEATPREVERIRTRVEAGDERVMLLEADIARLLRNALRANPHLAVDGIEERPEQRSARVQQNSGSREHSIETNFRTRYRPGRRNVVLYGAFHCSHRGGWLFRRLRERPPPDAPADALLNLRVAWEHVEAPFEAFVYFLDEIGFPRRDFVITDPGLLPDEIDEWFPFLNANELDAFGAVAVFRYEDRGRVAGGRTPSSESVRFHAGVMRDSLEMPPEETGHLYSRPSRRRSD